MDKKIAIGVDPPKGFAVWDCCEKEFIEIITLDFWGIIEKLKAYCIDPIGWQMYSPCHVYIEDSTQNKPVFDRTLDGVVGARAAKIAQNVGMNKARTALIIEFCAINDIQYTAIRPQKGSMTKLSAGKFKQITGYTGRTSEHGRDAAMLVFER